MGELFYHGYHGCGYVVTMVIGYVTMVTEYESMVAIVRMNL